ncbi:MAG: ABC transporter substrate-binding protein [Promethearchaeota archaeon]
MKKINVLALLGILMVSAMVFSVPPTAAAAPASSGVDDPVIFGTTSLGYDIDPSFSWDSASSDINNQIWEGLYAYNLGDPKLRIIPRLAADCGTWNSEATQFNVTLRENVTFSNGHPFNASTVKWSFDRLYYLCVNEDDQIRELYFPFGFNDTENNASIGYGYVINETVVVDNTHVSFNLNYPYAPFQALLCFTASMQFDPLVTPADDYVYFDNITAGMLVGTGPYKLTEYKTDHCTFEYNPTYYRGTPAIKKFIYQKFSTSTAISQALLAGDIDMPSGIDPDFMDDFEAAENIYVGPHREASIITYMGMNNKVIGKTIRQAINYATDYDYITHNIYNDLATRMTSIVPPGIATHIECDVPDFNITMARKILVDANVTEVYEAGLTMDSTDDDWIAVSKGSGAVGIYGYQYNLGNVVREDIGVLMKANLEKIGIHLSLEGLTWGNYLSKLFGDPDQLGLYLIGWMPDYNDPSNFINPLMSPTSSSNSAQVNDTHLNDLMAQGLREPDVEERAKIYEDIQHYIAEDLMPWVFITYPFGRSVRSNYVHTQRNAMGYLYVFPWGYYDTNTTFTDPYLEEWCNAGSPPVKEQEATSTAGGGIPGYSMFVMIGVAAATIAAIIKKRK